MENEIDETRVRAEWDNSPVIRNEFGMYGNYLAWKSAEARGCVKLYAPSLGTISSTTSAAQDQAIAPQPPVLSEFERHQKNIFDSSPDIRSEFGTFNSFLAYQRAESAHQIGIGLRTKIL